MKTRTVIPVLVFACVSLFAGPAAAGGLESFLDEVEIHASKDMGSFRADLKLTFDVVHAALERRHGGLDGVDTTVQRLVTSLHFPANTRHFRVEVLLAHMGTTGKQPDKGGSGEEASGGH